MLCGKTAIYLENCVEYKGGILNSKVIFKLMNTCIFK